MTEGTSLRAGPPRRVGLYGILGAGNIGNDASAEAVLRYLRARHPHATIDAMCLGPAAFTARYGVDAVPLQWSRRFGRRGKVIRVIGAAVDVIRTGWWVRRHDAVIVPGMGVLETTLHTGAAGMPFAMFLLGLWGRLCGTAVALVSVGANQVRQPVIRWCYDRGARLARYRSYRDAASRQAMAARGLDVSRDRVFPDLVFALPAETFPDGDPGIVGVGVMAYYGSNDERPRAAQIHAAYLAALCRLISSLVSAGRQVHLYTGDIGDDTALNEVRERLPELFSSGAVTVRPTETFAELTAAMAPAGLVIATRFHNIICALRLAKPVVALGYSAKTTELMASMRMSAYCQHAGAPDADLLIAQAERLALDWPELRDGVVKQLAANAAALEDQFDVLDAVLFAQPGPTARG